MLKTLESNLNTTTKTISLPLNIATSQVAGNWQPWQQRNTHLLRFYTILDVKRELPLVGFLVFFFQFCHVFGNMLTKDVITVDFSIKLIGFAIIAWKTFHTVAWKIHTYVIYQSTSKQILGWRRNKYWTGIVFMVKGPLLLHAIWCIQYRAKLVKAQLS